ncbi:prominin-1-A-like isoform 3-T3 [Sylvia borin]
MDLGNISKPTYGPGLEAPGSSTPGLVTMAHGFLRLVQPNALPTELINFGQPQSEFSHEDIHKLLLYELGFLICVAIGVLFIILVPLVGCCFCCCRCCGNCGGRMYQKQGRRMRCRRRALCASVLLVSAFLLAGGVCALISNTRFSQAVKSTFPNVNNTLEDVHTYLASIPQACMIPLPRLGGKGPGRRSSPNSPLGQGNRGAGSRERSPPSLIPHLCPYSKSILSSTGVMSHWTMPTAASRVRVCDGRGWSIPMALWGATPGHWAQPGQYDHLTHQEQHGRGSGISAERLARYWPHPWEAGKGLRGLLEARGGVGACLGKAPLEVDPFGLPTTPRGMETLKDTFGNIASSCSDLEELQSNYSQRLIRLRDRLNHTLQNCGLPCSQVSLDGLAFTTNFSTIPGVEQQLKALREVSDSKIETELEEVNRTLDMTPDKVQEQSQEVVAQSQDQLGLIRQEIRRLREELPLLDVEEKVGAFVNNATSVLEEYREPIIAWDRVRLIVCALLCCTVLLVVLCNVFGLLLGPLGLKEGVLPTERSCLSDAGGNFFMAGVGFSFIFSWLLMLLVMIIFVLGGNIYMFFCESWHNQQLFQVLDTPGMIPNFSLSELLGLKGDTANFSEIYRQCQQDASLWQTLHLDQNMSLDELLNISQLDQNLTQGSLLDLAAELDQLAEKVDTDTKKDLEDNARDLRELEKEMQASFSGPLQSLKENIHSVQSGAAQLEGQTAAALDKANKTQEFLEREMQNIIKNETRAFLEQLLDFFETYISWAKSRVTEDVARCKPIAQSLDNVEVIGCDYIMDSVNAFWFSLGWCTVFLLPTIILAVRLAKFYRRMDTADVYRNEDFEMPPTFNSYKIPRPSTRH